MSELRSVLEALAADDLHELSDGAVLERVALLVAVVNRANAELARTVRHADSTQAAEHDGLKSMQSWLRGHARLSAAEASRVVRSGRALEHLPAVAAAFAEGEVSAAQVAVIAGAVTEGNVTRAAAQGVELAPFDQLWAQVAAEAPFDALGPTVKAYENALDPDGPEPDPTEGRRLSMVRHADGSGTGRFDLDPVGFEKVQAAIESIVQASRPKGDERARAQQNADALVQLCDNQLAAGSLPTLRTQKPHVIVTIDAEDLTGTSTTGTGAGRTGFGAAISAARARWLACDGIISRIVLGPTASRWTSAALSGWCRRTSGGRSSSGMGTACSPAAMPRPTGATSTIWSSGSTAGRPRWTTPGWSANATTRRSTTASGSNEIPAGDGTPTAPTAPRSSSNRGWSPDSCRPSARRVRHLTADSVSLAAVVLAAPTQDQNHD
jgi:hypothetical protein